MHDTKSSSRSRFHGWRQSVLAGISLALLFFAPVAWSGTAIRFAPEKDYGPFVFEAEDGQITGLSIDVLNAIKPSLSASVDALPAQALAQILASAQRGEVDLISSLRPTRERAAYLSFTSPYVQVPAVLVVRQSISPARLHDLAGQRVAVGQGYAVEPFVRSNFPAVDWQAVPDDLTALRGLMQGKYQGVVADIASVAHATRVHEVQGIQVSQTLGFEYPLSFAYRKELIQLGQELETALQRLDPQTRQKITDRWIDAAALHFEDPKRTWLRWLGSGLVLLAISILGWAYIRQRRAGPAV